MALIVKARGLSWTESNRIASWMVPACGLGVLLLAAAAVWRAALSPPTGVTWVIAVTAGVLHVITVASVWPWRSAAARTTALGLRILVVIVAVFWLLSLFDTYAWVRSGVQPVSEYRGLQLHSEFQQGAYAVIRMVDYAATEAALPLLSLILLSVVPALHDSRRRLPSSAVESDSTEAS